MDNIVEKFQDLTVTVLNEPSITDRGQSANILDALDGIAGSIRTSLSSPAEDLSAHFLLDPDQRMGIPFALVLIARGLRELAEAIRGIKK